MSIIRTSNPDVLELESSRGVNFRLEFNSDSWCPSISGYIGDRETSEISWMRIIHIPFRARPGDVEKCISSDLECAVTILERVAACIRQEGARILEGIKEEKEEEEKEEEEEDEDEESEESVLNIRKYNPDIVEFQSARSCCANIRLEFTRNGSYPSIVGYLGIDEARWIQAFYIPIGAHSWHPEETMSDHECSAVIFERVAEKLRKEGAKTLQILKEKGEI